MMTYWGKIKYSCTPQPLYLRGSSPRYPQARRLCEPQGRSEHGGKENKSYHCPFQVLKPGRPPVPVSTLTELPRLLGDKCKMKINSFLVTRRLTWCANLTIDFEGGMGQVQWMSAGTCILAKYSYTEKFCAGRHNVTMQNFCPAKDLLSTICIVVNVPTLNAQCLDNFIFGRWNSKWIIPFISTWCWPLLLVFSPSVWKSLESIIRNFGVLFLGRTGKSKSHRQSLRPPPQRPGKIHVLLMFWQTKHPHQ